MNRRKEFVKEAKEFIESGIDPSSPDSMEVYCFYAFSLYLLDDTLLQKYLSYPVEEYPFIDYLTWAWIRGVMCLKGHAGMIELGRVQDRVWEVARAGEAVNVRAFQRVLRGEELDASVLEEPIRKDDKYQTQIIGLTHELIVMLAIRGDEPFPNQKIEELLRQCRQRFCASLEYGNIPIDERSGS